MRSRWALSALALTALVSATIAILIATNPAPQVPALSARTATAVPQPYVVKLHARWCPICMVTKSAWATVQGAYAGKVRFVVFDFTDAATTAASRATANQLGLDAVFDDYEGETGTVLVVDGTSKNVKQALHGIHSSAEYGAAIDAAVTTAHE